MNETIKAQIMAIKESGKVNMLSTFGVQAMAVRMGFKELSHLMHTNRKAYTTYIFANR